MSLKKCFFNVMFCVVTLNTVIAQQKISLPIGVFDSGTGGLTVLQAMLTLDAFNNITGKEGADGKPDFEKEYFQYLADQANMPYGNYAAEQKTDLLKEHILKNMDFLLGKTYSTVQQQQTKSPVKMIVIACNTATAYALEDIKKVLQSTNTGVACIGVIEAGAKAALLQQKRENGTIGIFATAGTVASNGYPRTLQRMAKSMGIDFVETISQGGVGLAESIDRDWSYFVDTVSVVRTSYKGPSIKNTVYTIDTNLLAAYHFNQTANQVLCEYNEQGKCLDMQLNDPANYTRYHLVSMLEKLLKTPQQKPLNTLILGCTHYPYMKDTIAKVLQELYNFKQNGQYKYRQCLSEQVTLIDPAIETAKEAYVQLRLQKLQQTIINQQTMQNQFFITVPNKQLTEIKLQEDGWFTYNYKYGRVVGAHKNDVEFVKFDTKNVSLATYLRFKQALPNVYRLLQQSVKGL